MLRRDAIKAALAPIAAPVASALPVSGEPAEDTESWVMVNEVCVFEDLGRDVDGIPVTRCAGYTILVGFEAPESQLHRMGRRVKSRVRASGPLDVLPMQYWVSKKEALNLIRTVSAYPEVHVLDHPGSAS